MDQPPAMYIKCHAVGLTFILRFQTDPGARYVSSYMYLPMGYGVDITRISTKGSRMAISTTDRCTYMDSLLVLNTHTIYGGIMICNIRPPSQSMV